MQTRKNIERTFTALSFAILAAILAAAFFQDLAIADVVSDLNKIETVGTSSAPKVIAGAILLAVAGSIAFTVLGGRAAHLGTRLAVSLLTIAVAYLIIVNTEIGTALNDMLNISSPKSMFQRR